MAFFRIGAQEQAPLFIQIGTTADSMVEVRHILVCGDNSIGAASGPVFTYPGTPGSGTGTIVSLSGPIIAKSIGITSFTTTPSVPAIVPFSNNLPRRFSIMTPRGSGPIIPPSSFGLLYVNAIDGHTCTGELRFEEF